MHIDFLTMVNPQILQLIKELKLPKQESQLFCLLWWAKKYMPGIEDCIFMTINDKKLIALENEEIYRINFLKLEEGELVLKYPLFIKEQVNSFDTFVKKIADTRLLNSRGHVNNPQDYPVYDVSKDTREAFNQLPELDLDKACEVVIRYYETTKPAQKFSNYLGKGFIVDYNQYE